MWWALTALGFSIAVFPFLTVIGFRGGLARPFGTAAALLLAFLPFKVTVGWAGLLLLLLLGWRAWHALAAPFTLL